jgi:DNA-binding transcriptional ArsR family regulator
MSRRRSAAAIKFSEAAPVFAALGETTRLTLVAKLCAEGPLSIARLSEGTGVTRQAITKHLHTLAHAGVVHGSRSGRERIWELETRRLAKARRCLDQISDQWDAAISRLRAFVEESPGK